VVPLGARAHNYQVPVVEHPVRASFGDRAMLLGYDLKRTPPEREPASLHLSLHWQALPVTGTRGIPLPDYVVFVHLYDPEREAIVAQSDARPLRGTYPTNAWQPGEIIEDEIVLGLDNVAPGTYRLAVGMSEVHSHDRAPIADASGEPLPDGRLVLEPALEVPER
jgi:hypothetical protein